VSVRRRSAREGRRPAVTAVAGMVLALVVVGCADEVAGTSDADAVVTLEPTGNGSGDGEQAPEDDRVADDADEDGAPSEPADPSDPSEPADPSDPSEPDGA
jgi:hypothetical protein